MLSFFKHGQKQFGHHEGEQSALRFQSRQDIRFLYLAPVRRWPMGIPDVAGWHALIRVRQSADHIPFRKLDFAQDRSM
tara:strand:+ start:270 stop:503 length:234 start_codon:yes stop_codon:yes gene_type:complete